MQSTSIATLIVLAGVTLAALILFRPRLARAPLWRAKVTPLASIIGSGFLVLAPLLVHEFGSAAVWAMLALCLTAYALGGAIRWNIRALEGAGRAGQDRLQQRLETWSSWSLAFAYVVSVCYYLNLLGSFALGLFADGHPVYARALTSAALVMPRVPLRCTTRCNAHSPPGSVTVPAPAIGCAPPGLSRWAA